MFLEEFTDSFFFFFNSGVCNRHLPPVKRQDTLGVQEEFSLSGPRSY